VSRPALNDLWLDDVIVSIGGFPTRPIYSGSDLVAYVAGNRKSRTAPEILKRIEAHDELVAALKALLKAHYTEGEASLEGLEATNMAAAVLDRLEGGAK
jgi:hypothetical protein